MAVRVDKSMLVEVHRKALRCDTPIQSKALCYSLALYAFTGELPKSLAMAYAKVFGHFNGAGHA